jgi:hypothetical protein
MGYTITFSFDAVSTDHCVDLEGRLEPPGAPREAAEEEAPGALPRPEPAVTVTGAPQGAEVEQLGARLGVEAVEARPDGVVVCPAAGWPGCCADGVR